MSFNAADYQHPEFIVKEIEPGFINLQFNNPKTLNAFAESTWRGYQDLLEKIDKHPATKVILISSPLEKAFSSGLNLKAAMGLFNSSDDRLEKERYQELHQHIVEFQHAIHTPARIRTPTICILNGISYGLAIDIASACTIRYATKDAKLSIREIKIGIVADMGSLQRLPNLVGNLARINEYALTGCIFNGDEALEIGLVSRVFPDLKSAYEYSVEIGQDINTSVEWAVKGTKDTLQHMTLGATAESGLKQIAEYNAIHIGGFSGVPKL